MSPHQQQSPPQEESPRPVSRDVPPAFLRSRSYTRSSRTELHEKDSAMAPLLAVPMLSCRSKRREQGDTVVACSTPPRRPQRRTSYVDDDGDDDGNDDDDSNTVSSEYEEKDETLRIVEGRRGTGRRGGRTKRRSQKDKAAAKTRNDGNPIDSRTLRKVAQQALLEIQRDDELCVGFSLLF